MPRNLDKRVEIMFPVEDEECKKAVKHILSVQLADNVKAHILQLDGSYSKIDKRGKVLVILRSISARRLLGKQRAWKRKVFKFEEYLNPLLHVDE